MPSRPMAYLATFVHSFLYFGFVYPTHNAIASFPQLPHYPCLVYPPHIPICNKYICGQPFRNHFIAKVITIYRIPTLFIQLFGFAFMILLTGSYISLHLGGIFCLLFFLYLLFQQLVSRTYIHKMIGLVGLLLTLPNYY